MYVMAIVLEQEKHPVNWVSLATAAVVIVSLFAGGYYLFFKKPELIETVTPEPVSDLSTISQIVFDPESVINSPTFKLLRQYETDIVIPPAGRSNPFRPF